jgi:hypothetical protein
MDSGDVSEGGFVIGVDFFDFESVFEDFSFLHFSFNTSRKSIYILLFIFIIEDCLKSVIRSSNKLHLFNSRNMKITKSQIAFLPICENLKLTTQNSMTSSPKPKSSIDCPP